MQVCRPVRSWGRRRGCGVTELLPPLQVLFPFPASGELAAHPVLYRCERRGQAARLVAARHRQVRLAAALAADLGGDEVDQITGLDPAGDVWRHRGDQADLAV